MSRPILGGMGEPKTEATVSWRIAMTGPGVKHAAFVGVESKDEIEGMIEKLSSHPAWGLYDTFVGQRVERTVTTSTTVTQARP